MTYRERRERRAERLREWAAKRAARATAEERKFHAIADGIPLGQPILVGHHSEKRHRRDVAKMDGALQRRHEHATMASSMTSRAGTIEDQLERSIYSDDPDALERLREKLADLEAMRERIKAFNASCRKGKPNPELLDADERALYLESARHSMGHDPAKGFPRYTLTNLGGNITRTRQRIADVEREQRAREACEAAGGILVTRSDHGYCSVRFEEKPERAVLEALKGAGFRWGGGAWVGYTEKLPAEVLELEAEAKGGE